MKVAAIALAGLLAAGCAQLTVAVDILDPVLTEALAEDSGLRVQYIKISRSSPGAVEKEVKALRTRHLQAFKALADAYRKRAESISDDGLKQLLVGSATDLPRQLDSGSATDDYYKKLKEALVQGNEAVTKAAAGWQVLSTEPIPSAVRQALMERRDAVQPIQSELLKNIRDAEADAPLLMADGRAPGFPLTPAITKKLAATKSAIRSITRDGSLAASEYAYPVASASEEMWATSFNRAFGRGIFGDSDIIIKMSQKGEFTVKGMQFDPSTVAAVASKVTTQALLLATQIAGVPVGAAALQAGKDGTPGLAGTGDSVVSIDEMLAKRDAEERAWKAAVRDIAQTILAEEGTITKGDVAALGTAGSAIKSAYDAYEETLKLDSMN